MKKILFFGNRYVKVSRFGVCGLIMSDEKSSFTRMRERDLSWFLMIDCCVVYMTPMFLAVIFHVLISEI